MKRIDIVGQRYGKIVVKDMKYGVKKNKGGKGRTYCVCECDCGNETEILMDNIRSGRARSCGCDAMKRRIAGTRKDLTGKRFNRLTVMQMIWDERPTKCKCVCDCGNEVIVAGADLTNGHTQSCGCLQREKASLSNTKNWEGFVNNKGIKFIRRSSMNKRGQWLWICECPICHKEFEALPAKININEQMSCGCAKMSNGEMAVERILKKYKVSYSKQYKMDGCYDKQSLLFDFAIHLNNTLILIEYDGQQHYKSIDLFGGEEEYKKRIKHDNMKNEYCKKNGITLLRIPYTLTIEQIEQEIINVLNPERLPDRYGNIAV